MLEQFNLYELIGVLLGDGYLAHFPVARVYFIEIAGHAKESKEYFVKIQRFIKEEFGLPSRIRVRREKKGESLRLVCNSKELVEFIMNNLEVSNKNKTFNAKIAEEFLDWEIARHILRGLFESDGCLYFSKGKRRMPYYPRLEIKTSSEKLIEQIIIVLQKQNFRVHRRRCGSPHTFGVYISGSKMIEKWVNEIGFGSYRNFSKYLVWKKINFYKPRLSLTQRKNILSGGSQAAKGS